LVAGAALGSSKLAWAAKKPLPVGIQLYTVRDMMQKDLDGTLHAVAAAGYEEVEAAGYYGRSAADFKKAVDAAGLRCVSVHHGLNQLLPKPEETIEYVHNLGAKFLICPWAGPRDSSRQLPNMEDWKYSFEQFNLIGEKCKAAGLRFGYHNHRHEFAKLDGVMPYEELLKNTDPALVCMELDCGWVAAAGLKPLDFVTKYPTRIVMLHVKDMIIDAADESKSHSTELGRGSIDYVPLMAAAKHVEHYFIEQEEFEDMPALEAIKVDADYMHKMKA
jgi:sugar phosphate isomerase/epimerase